MRSWLGIGGVVVGVLGGIGLITSACSSSTAPYPDVGSFCTALAAAQCQSGGDAGGAGIPATCTVPVEQCNTAADQACLANAQQILAGGTQQYTQANVAACIEVTAATYTGAPISFTTYQEVTETCSAVFAGSVPLMGSCKTTGACAQPPTEGGVPSVVCATVAPGSTEKVCATATTVAEGAYCENPGDTCPVGSYCTGSPAPRCQPGGTSASNCSATVGCAVGFYCEISPGATTGSCVEAGQLGSACSSNANCGPSAPLCDPNVPPKTGSGTGTCVLELTFATGADDCKPFGGS